MPSHQISYVVYSTFYIIFIPINLFLFPPLPAELPPLGVLALTMGGCHLIEHKLPTSGYNTKGNVCSPPHISLFPLDSKFSEV